MMDHFRAFWTKIVAAPIAALLVRMGVSPDAVTLVGTLGVCAGALVFFPQGKLLTGVLVITAFVFSDLIDGTMARSTGRVSKFGAFWDSTLDRIADGAIFIGLALYFAWEEPSRLYLVLSLVCLLMGAVTSYARSRGETLGYDVKVGIAERADRLVAILVMTGLGAIFDQPWMMYAALWFLAVASTITVGQRIWVVRKQALAEAAAG
ncbi:CDP-alcohol phosphatidyltransferase family protein [Nocardioides sp. dk4132]|uniref:phosphatidylinositol phosphate synthase n=1 Tax=unclassified Nocardioides TaxID=2615069 RepID=UPI001296A943|nr:MULTISPECIES: CDP-alcohol phosphatidyltransferase family protein [unclassified Nocardioides]MQW74907.1 CDP-alcohol phosphatidyltransferase family protein [Nocardioides sp. dk4132]QGA07902.1 CDP-alcohol phosphatidyltransferase family protein [Nocardioides sp. dk884]